MSVRVVCADAIAPGEEPPFRDGAICLEEDGRVIDVGSRTDMLARYAGARVETVRGVLLPGLVNAHAHVELSALRGKVQGGAGFVPWVERMIALRVAEPPEDDDDAIERAAAELEAFGTVAIGEVTNTLAAVKALAGHGIGGIVFHEVFGLDRAQALARLSKLESDAAAPHSGVLYVALYGAANNPDTIVGGDTASGDCHGRKVARNLAGDASGTIAINIPITPIPSPVHANTVHAADIICKALFAAVHHSSPAAETWAPSGNGIACAAPAAAVPSDSSRTSSRATFL